MRLSKAYWQTYKEVPSDAEVASHQLLMRAGFIHKTAGGIYSYLPFAKRVLRKIEKIICEELEDIGAQEVTMGMVTPAELWRESGRWDQMGPLMLKFQDRKENDFCLSPTNEETVTDIFRKTISSYKQLPVNLFQINTKFRDETRPRFGLLRGREFIMKDGYTFDLDKAGLDVSYDNYYRAYSNIFSRMKLDYIIVEADGGAMASKDSKTHEFQLVADAGEDVVVEAKELNYAANIEKAKTYRPSLGFTPASDVTDIETVNLSTCDDVCKMLGVPVHQSLKTLVYTATYGAKKVHYMVMLLGDDSLNEVKFHNFLGADAVEIADPEVLANIGAPKGYMSPLGAVQEKVSVLFDEAIDVEKSYIVGANKENYHVKGFTPKRDVKNFKIVDLRMAKEGDLAFDKKTPIKLRRGIEVGHVFQLGDKYTKSMNATVLDQNGKKIVPLMGCYGIGVSRVMAAAIEQSHDENGIIWPAPIAPFDVYFALIGKSEAIKETANEIYNSLKQEGFEVLFDDRGMGPGPMFKDSDLLGLPVRVVLGERDFEASGELEIKIRKTGEVIKVKKENLASTLKNELKKLGK